MSHDERPAALIIAAHGTRDPAGVEQCHQLAARVAQLLPGTRVEVGFVEITPPPIDEILAAVLADESSHGDPRVVVLPLMIGTGGHVQRDIPEAIERGRRGFPAAQVVQASHLGPDERMLDAVRLRVEAARGDWAAQDVHLVMVGRGTLHPPANAEHFRLSAMVSELGGFHAVHPCFIQVATPDLPTALRNAAALGAQQIVTMPHYLFAGRLRSWVHEQCQAFAAEYPQVQVRVAEVIGPCDELAQVVASRYRTTARRMTRRITLGTAQPGYLTGLRLEGRLVIVVGGGAVAERRVRRFLDAGAIVRLIAPEVTGDLATLAEEGTLEWVRRDYHPGDITHAPHGPAWFVLAATNDAEANTQVAAEAEAAHCFCNRADRAAESSAWTPTLRSAGAFSVAVLGSGDPHRAMRAAEVALDAIIADQQ